MRERQTHASSHVRGCLCEDEDHREQLRDKIMHSDKLIVLIQLQVVSSSIWFSARTAQQRAPASSRRAFLYRPHDLVLSKRAEVMQI